MQRTETRPQMSDTIRPIQDWEQTQIRATAFHSQATDLDHSNWWLEMAGQRPQTTLTFHWDGRDEDRGSLLCGELLLRKVPGRVDLVLTAVPSAGGATFEFPTLGNPNEVCIGFFDLAKRLLALGTFPPVTRLAVAGGFALPVENRQLGYEQLGRFLPDVRIDPINSSELFYQINRPRAMCFRTQKEIVVNRISKWNVVSQELQEITPGQSPRISHSFSYCNLESDVSTDKDVANGEFSPDDLDQLWKLSLELCEKGDIP